MDLLVFRFWKVSETESGNPMYVIASCRAASSAPLAFATMARSFDLLFLKSILARTPAVSRICGIAFGDTKTPSIMAAKLMTGTVLRQSVFDTVGIKQERPCKASLGQSMAFMAENLFYEVME